jgi:hypothetical protein
MKASSPYKTARLGRTLDADFIIGEEGQHLLQDGQVRAG